MDTRVTRKEEIFSAINQLANQKGLSKVKVVDIVNQLKINRGTFYLYFQDLPDAIDQMEQSLLAPILQRFQEEVQHIHKPQDSEREKALYGFVCWQIAQDFDRWRLFFSDKGDPNFAAQIRAALLPYVLPQLAEKQDKDAFIRYVMTDSLISISRHWVLAVPQLSPDKVAEIIYDTRHQSPLSLAGLDGKNVI